MALLFVGKHQNPIDAKGRVSVPAPFRKALAEDGEDGRKGFVCQPRPGWRMLEGLARSVFQEHIRAINEKRLNDPSEYERLIAPFAEAEDLSWDAGGRISLPAELIEAASLEKEVLFIGAGDHFRLWNPAAYKTFQAGVLKDAKGGGGS